MGGRHARAPPCRSTSTRRACATPGTPSCGPTGCPVRDGVDPDAPDRALAAERGAVAALAGDGRRPTATGLDVATGRPGASGRPGAAARLAGLYRVVLPRLVTTYERHLRAVAPVTDAPLGRALRLVLRDEIEDWQAGERLVQRLVTRPHDVAAVHGFLQHLESVAVGAGAASGLVTFPRPGPGRLSRPACREHAGHRTVRSEGLTRPVNFVRSDRCARIRHAGQRPSSGSRARVGRPPRGGENEGPGEVGKGAPRARRRGPGPAVPDRHRSVPAADQGRRGPPGPGHRGRA